MPLPTTSNLCCTPQCQCQIFSKGVCKKHYLESRRRQLGVPPKADSPATCTVGSCSDKHVALGFCRRHYQYHHRARTENPKLGICSIADCTVAQGYRLQGLCAHHHRIRKESQSRSLASFSNTPSVSLESIKMGSFEEEEFNKSLKEDSQKRYCKTCGRLLKDGARMYCNEHRQRRYMDDGNWIYT